MAVGVGLPAGAVAGALPTRYAKQMNALCLKAKKEIGATPKLTGDPTPAQIITVFGRASAVMKRVVAEGSKVTPPANLAAAVRRTTAALQRLITGIDTLVAKLRSGATLEVALDAAKANLLAGLAGAETGFKQLGLTTCAALLKNAG